ncbi:MAG: DNA alkylation repair protein [Rikenellaceae bacterium]
MNNEEIRDYLDAHSDAVYREFHSKLVPNITIFRGVRLPVIRQLAKIISEGDALYYLDHASLESYEECMLYGLVIGSLKGDFQNIEPYITRFIPYIDNWAVCDCFCVSLKITTKKKAEMFDYINHYLDSEGEYEVRFGVVMLMNYYIEDDYIDLLLHRFETIKKDAYYVKMAVAWAISLCYVRHCAKTLSFLQQNSLDDWTQNKAIQKIVESRRVSDSDKMVVRSYKR